MVFIHTITLYFSPFSLTPCSQFPLSDTPVSSVVSWSSEGECDGSSPYYHSQHSADKEEGRSINGE